MVWYFGLKKNTLYIIHVLWLIIDRILIKGNNLMLYNTLPHAIWTLNNEHHSSCRIFSYTKRLNTNNSHQLFYYMITFAYQKAKYEHFTPAFWLHDNLCIPESLVRTFHTSFLTTKQPFINSQHENTNSKGDFVLTNRFKTLVVKISGIQR